jgi:amino acid transporter
MNEQVLTPQSSRTADPGGGEELHLKGKIGTIELMLTVLAFSAPLTVVAAFAVFVLGYNRSAPVAFAVAIVLLLLFAVGYTTMTRYLPNPGAFYAYITAGIGRFPGLGSSFLAMFGYVTMGVGTVCFFGVIASDLVDVTFGGPKITWWIYSLVCVAVAGGLGYFRVDLSAKVLSVVMGCEVLIVLLFNGAVLVKNGPEGRSFEPFSLGIFASDEVGLAVLFAATCFLGFEATAIFREETKNPDKTIPRATYGAVLFIGVFYLVSVWTLILAYGPSKAQGVAHEHYDGMFSTAAGQYLGAWATDVIRVLLCSSIFACLLAVQNILSRYVFSLGVDHVLPSRLGKVHPTHRSPYVAALTVMVVMLLVVAGVAVMGADPNIVYAALAGTGGFAVLVLMFLTGISAFVFFWRRKDIERKPFHMFVAPALSVISLGIVLYLSMSNFTTVTGGSQGEAWALQISLWSTFAIGLLLAAYYRVYKPDIYQRIGRQKVG